MLTGWRPFRENHAIERVSLTCAFEDELPAKLWEPLHSRAAELLFREGLVPSAVSPVAGQQMQQFIEIRFGPGGFPQQISQDVRSFRLIRSNDLIEEVVLTRSSIHYTTTRYSRWAQFRDRINNLLAEAFRGALVATNIRSSKLEYWDRFFSTGGPTEARQRDLLNVASRSLPAICFDAPDLWHCHIGYFVPGENGQKRLINANVDVIDVALPSDQDGAPSAHRSVGFYTMAEDRYEAPAIGPSEIGALLGSADLMHEVLKSTLLDIISCDAADSILLKARAQ